jgi:hypothetical protein
MFFKTSLQPMALPDGVERFDFNGCTYVTSVDGRPFIERTTADDEDVNFTMCVAPPPPHTHSHIPSINAAFAGSAIYL